MRCRARSTLLIALSVLCGGLALGLGWVALRPTGATPSTAVHVPPAVLDPAQPALALVFVSGAVVRPGLYHLSPGARIADAVAAAGGFTPDADPGRMPNLAARIHDGHQVNVPFLRATGGRTVAAKLDVNSATLDELRAVPGMPIGLPEAIVSFRDLFGPFRSMTDMRLMLGLDRGTLSGLRPYLRVVPVTQ